MLISTGVKINLRYLLWISLISALAGFLFGYDWVVIGGAKPFYEHFFEISHLPGLLGLALGSALAGCVIGAAISGWISDISGRKASLMMAALLFTVSSVGTGLINAFPWFISFRIIGGIGIGLASAITPVYISEISPSAFRGRLVSLYHMNIVLGIIAARIVNYLIAKEVPVGSSGEFIRASWNGQMGWRWMFWAESAPALIFLVLLIFIPESPRWLMRLKRWEKADWVLQMIGGEEYARKTRSEIAGSFSESDTGVKITSLFKKGLRPALVVGLILAVFQQWCGINVVLNYAEELFSSADCEVSEILMDIVVTGGVTLIFCLLAILTVDRWGRRKLMLLGALGLAILYSTIGMSYLLNLEGSAVLVIIVLSIAVYSMTLAPVTWVILSEIFPNRVRGIAMSLATTVLWIASAVLVVTFPYFNRGLNAHGTFWLHAGICLAGFLFIYYRLPETKGKSLEEIEKNIGGGSPGK